MEDINKYSEFLDKCRDKSYVKTHIQEINQTTSTKAFKSAMRALISTKRNLSTLSSLHAIGYPCKETIPSLDNKKNLNQFVYSSIYWMHKQKIVGDEEFQGYYTKFSCIKNFEKMVSDISDQYLMHMIETDRRKMKIEKEASVQVFNRSSEIDDLMKDLDVLGVGVYKYPGVQMVDEFVVYVNVDDVFDLSSHSGAEYMSAKKTIGSIKTSLDEMVGDLCNFDPEFVDDQSLINYMSRIRNDGVYRYENSKILHSLDKSISSRITRLYNNILALQRFNVPVVILSKCSLAQVLAEILFFGYGCIEVQNVFTVKNGLAEGYKSIFSRFKGRSLVFDKDCSLKNDDGVYILDRGMMNDMISNLIVKNSI